MSKIHIISIGGSAMHNIAIALKNSGHEITGSDDEIYNPSRQKLEKCGLLPSKMGWDENNISADIDFIILGMHAREDNPELAKAKKLGIKIYSYPEFIYNHSINKKRIIIGGSQGKTTTTSMIIWVLKKLNLEFDYLVGGNVEGFDLMVKLSDAPIIVMEGDEYLSSAMDRRPKFHHYKPHIAVLTGIDWDHMNVFPTFENYVKQFDIFINSIEKNGALIYYKNDKELVNLTKNNTNNIKHIPYDKIDNNHELQVFGDHNLSNINAALLVCQELGITEEEFFKSIADFKGTEKRLQKISENENTVKFLDFAHAPAKLRATINAVRKKYPNKKLYAFYELHTYSSLNRNFLPQYKHSMKNCDFPVVFYNSHTLEMKKMPPLDKTDVKNFFAQDNITVFDNSQDFKKHVESLDEKNSVFLFMSSGTFGGTLKDMGIIKT